MSLSNYQKLQRKQNYRRKMFARKNNDAILAGGEIGGRRVLMTIIVIVL